MPLLFRNIRSGKRRALITELNSQTRKALEQAMDQQVKPALVKSHNLVVANWTRKPTFQGRKVIKAASISVTVFPVGDNAEIWGYVDQGTRPHVIKPKGPWRLRFQTGYQPKTLASPARTVAGGGKATGPVVFAKKVKHPGNKGREFSKTIAEDIKPDFNRIIDNTFRRIARQMEE